MSDSAQRKQQLQALLEQHGLKLSLADLISFTYEQWRNDYLSYTVAADHICDSLKRPIKNVECVEGSLQHLINLGRSINEANK